MKQDNEKRHCIGIRHPAQNLSVFSRLTILTGGPVTLTTAKRLATVKCKTRGKGYYAVIGWIENFDYLADIDKKPTIVPIYSNQSGKWEKL